MKRSRESVSDYIRGIIELSLCYYEELGLEEFTQQHWLVLLALVHLPDHKKYEPLFEKYGDVVKKNGLWNEKHHHEGEWLATLTMFKNDLHYMEKKSKPKRRKVRTPMDVEDMVLDESAQMNYLNVQIPFSNRNYALGYFVCERNSIQSVVNKRRYSTPSPSLNLQTPSSSSDSTHSQNANLKYRASKRSKDQKSPYLSKKQSPCPVDASSSRPS